MSPVHAALSNGKRRGELIEDETGDGNTTEQQQKRKPKWTASYSDFTIAQLKQSKWPARSESNAQLANA